MSAMRWCVTNQALWYGVQPGHKGNQLLKRDIVSNAEAILYVVPAGKVAGISHIDISVKESAVGSCWVFLYNATDAVRYVFFNFVPTGAGQSRFQSKSYWPVIEAAAGWYIKIKSSVDNIILDVSLHGWEE